MPAGLPDETDLNNAGNPNAGRCVIMDPLSGPKNTPFDNDSGTISTGGLSTGIGFGSPPVIGPLSNPLISNALAGIRAAGFSDDYIPGVTLPSGVAATESTLVYIGGGRSDADGTPDPYDADAVAICMAGNGGSRDGSDPTGFSMKVVTAAGAVANGAAVEAGWVNRSGLALVADQSVLGSAVAENPIAV